MKKRSSIVLFLIIIFLLPACSNIPKDEQSTADDGASYHNNKMDANMEIAEQDSSISENEEGNAINNAVDLRKSGPDEKNRMVIYTADMQMQVKKYTVAEKEIIEQAEKMDGYLVESQVYRDADDQISGSLTMRIPTGAFDAFLIEVERSSVEVISRNISGQDVTEQYVDLESRLASKKIVEIRLLEFMEQATKTEDLLKISADLARVQEEIEQITGKIKYLQNQTDYSSVSLYLFEDNVVPYLNKENQNMLERIKEQLVVSTNVLLASVTTIIVFAIGNIPIIFVVTIIVAAMYYLIKKGMLRRKQKASSKTKELPEE